MLMGVPLAVVPERMMRGRRAVFIMVLVERGLVEGLER